MKKNRILTESEAYFPRCVALPARETLLLEEEMMLYMGQSGGVTRTTPKRTPKPTPAVITAGDANKIINSQTPKEVEDLSKMAVFGVIPVGNTDSSATSVRRELENLREALTDTSSSAPPTNSDSTTEDTSETWWDTIKGWVGF